MRATILREPCTPMVREKRHVAFSSGNGRSERRGGSRRRGKKPKKKRKTQKNKKIKKSQNFPEDLLLVDNWSPTDTDRRTDGQTAD